VGNGHANLVIRGREEVAVPLILYQANSFALAQKTFSTYYGHPEQA
jgi:hypothetical protein